jgi:hypothetical protein
MPSYFCIGIERGKELTNILLEKKKKKKKILKIRESIRVTYENRLKNKPVKRRSQAHEAFNFRSLVAIWSLKTP